MKIEIEIKEISLNSDKQYLVDSYPSSGLYIVSLKDKNEINVCYVSKLSSRVWFIDALSRFEDAVTVFEKEGLQEEEGNERTVSEEFVLKTLAIVANKESYKNLK